MLSVILEQPRTVRVVGTDPPRPRAGEALVRLRLAGICGSDLAAYRGTSPLVRYPVVLGHELVVDVLACPDRPDLVGWRAVVEPLLACGQCPPCRKGRYNCCTHLQVLGVHVDGGLREQFTVPAHRLHPVPEGMPDEVAVLAEPTTIAYRAVQRAQVEAGQVAVVFGAGPIGLLIATLLLRARGCHVLVVDVDPWRLQVAQRLGTTPVNARDQDVAAAVDAATGGEMASAVFEATGAAECTRLATAVVGYTGRIVLVGWNKGPTPVDTVVEDLWRGTHPGGGGQLQRGQTQPLHQPGRALHHPGRHPVRHRPGLARRRPGGHPLPGHRLRPAAASH